MVANWDDYRYFLTLSRKNSFVAAAAELRVTHTTVARRITGLEEALQTRLFHRTEKGCQLTPSGEQLLPYAEQLESVAINLEETVSGYDTELSGAIRVGAPDGIGNSYLPSCLAGLQALHPMLEIELIAVPMYYSLSKREIDILITVKQPVSGNIVARKLTDYRLGLFASREYLGGKVDIRTIDDLEGHKFISYIDDLLFDTDLHFMDEISPGLDIKFRSSTVVAQMNAVSSGLGIGVIPYFMARDNMDLVPVLPERKIERSYWIQVNQDSRKLKRVRTTIDHIVSRIDDDRSRFLDFPPIKAESE